MWMASPQAELALAIDAFPAADAGTRPDPAAVFLAAARIQEAARAADARLEGQLAIERYVPIDRVEIDLRPLTPDEVELVPRPVGVPNGVVERELSRPGDRVDPSWDHREDGRVTRYCLAPQVREVVRSVRRKGRLRGGEIPRAAEAPEAVLEMPDEVLDAQQPVLDLRAFSDRVKGIDLAPVSVTPRFALRGERGNWSDLGNWVAEDDRGHALDLPPGVLAALVARARETGEGFQLHEGRWLDLRDAVRAEEGRDAAALIGHPAVEVEHGQPAAAFSQEPTTAPPPPRGVLLIHENLDDLTYGRGDGGNGLSVPLLEQPPSVALPLEPHQVEGYSWLSAREGARAGGLLADEMGLGKTPQVIAVLARLLEDGALRPSLAVVPKGLVQNWMDEIARFCPRLSDIVVHCGPGRSRTMEGLSRHDLVLTTYETLRRDQLLLGRIPWRIVVCDEAQKIKNAPSGATRALKAMQADARFAMTGTPVENTVLDLWCIVDYCQPGLLGSQAEFKRRFAEPIETGSADVVERSALELKETVAPAYLRRTKQVLRRALPPKHENRFEVPLSTEQEREYAAVVQRAKAGPRHAWLSAIQELVRLCSHDWALREALPAPLDVQEALRRCPKLEATLSLLSEIERAGGKAIIFTRYRIVQDLLKECIVQRFARPTAVLNGDLDSKRRQAEVTAFNRSPGFDVMILSPDAAGVGLNITGANHVVHYTRVWNPAMENQATDRAHRMGQTRPVTVHLPITTSLHFETAEQKIDRRLRDKAAIATEVVVPRRIQQEIENELVSELFGAAHGT
ncbi:MAG: DEAD/DEAH box helicase [Deltaproteobacteria bacterium]|nr:DEAD/DEAH box helicase [Deltaproteobacteria bacterium]